MERLITIDEDDLAAALRLTPEERLRQANAAFRLHLALHRPFERPIVRGFKTLEEFFAFETEDDGPR